MGLLMGLIGLGLAGYVVFLALERVPKLKAFFCSDTDRTGFLSASFWREVSADKELKTKILLALGIMLVYKLAVLIPIPGVSFAALAEMADRMNQSMGFRMTSAFSRAVMGPFTWTNLFSLGLMPYLSACVLLQFLGVVIFPLRRLFFGEGQGVQRIKRYTLVLALFLCLAQSFFLSLHLERFAYRGVHLVARPGWTFRIIAVLSMMAAFCVMLWLASLISKKGIGNGIAMLVLTDVLVKVVLTVGRGFQMLRSDVFSPAMPLLYAALLIVLLSFAVFIVRWKKTVCVEIGPEQVNIPLRLSCLGKVPTSIAMSLLLLPATLAGSFSGGGMWNLSMLLQRGNVIFYVVMAGLTVLLSYVYMAIVISPECYGKLLSRYGGKVKGGSKNAEDVFYSGFNRVTLLIGILLAALAGLPDVFMAFFKAPYFVSSVFGGLEVLIVVGVAGDTLEQLKARMDMAKLDCHKACAVFLDEIEAGIKACYLRSQGIGCVVEPFRMTWGMPVRTAVDEYRLNVSVEKLGQAKELLAGKKRQNG